MKNALVERMLYITLAVVFVGQMLVTGVLLHQIKQGREQTKILTQQVVSLAKVSKDQGEILSQLKILNESQGKTTEEINRSLSCILVFFTTPNRAQYFISDLNTCTITNIGTGEKQILTIPDTKTTTPLSDSSKRSTSEHVANNPPANQPPSQSNPTAPAPTKEPSIVEQVINNTTDFTCGLVGLLCR